jgi:type I site-specific restriction endonuclease
MSETENALLSRTKYSSSPVFFRFSRAEVFVIVRAFMPSPEELARQNIDALLKQCGWIIQKRSEINVSAGRGIAITEGLLKGGDEADYLLFVDGKAIGTVEAKPEGFTSTGVEEQSGKYGKGLLDIYPKWQDPLPFAYESTGVETQFTNRLDPLPKSRNVFAFLGAQGCRVRNSAHRPWSEPEDYSRWY